MIITQLANKIYSPTTYLLIDNTHMSREKNHFLFISSLPIDFTSRAFFGTKFTPHLCGILNIHHSKYTHLPKKNYSNRSNILHTAIRMIFTLMDKTFYLQWTQVLHPNNSHIIEPNEQDIIVGKSVNKKMVWSLIADGKFKLCAGYN